MRNRLRFAEKVAGVSALALIGFLFLDWFGITGGNGVSGWDSLGWFALALCVLAILVGLALPLVFGFVESPVLPLTTAIAAMLLGGLAVIALLVQAVLQPGPDEVVGVQSGWWLGLLAAAGVARGGFLSMRDEYLPGVPLADIELRPAPPAAPAA
ncbi:MAG: hypothetical protein WKF96_21490 [Solirubrobacteraceae bacterium]